MSAWHKMSERESLFARRYKLSPSEGRIFCALHDAQDYVPHRIVHAISDTRKVLISTLRKEGRRLQDHQCSWARVSAGDTRMKARSHVRSIMSDEDRRAGV